MSFRDTLAWTAREEREDAERRRREKEERSRAQARALTEGISAIEKVEVVAFIPGACERHRNQTGRPWSCAACWRLR
jgi:hypothetical protein